MAATHFLTLSLLSLSLLIPSQSLSNHCLITLKKPLNFLSPISFSTHFSFSLSPNSTLSLLLIPSTFPLKDFQCFAIEFSSGSIRIGEKTASFHPGSRESVDFIAGSVKNGEKATFFDPGSRENVDFVAGSVKNEEKAMFSYPGSRQNENYNAGSVKKGEKMTFFDPGSRRNENYSVGSGINGENMTFFYLGNPQNGDSSTGSIRNGEMTENFDLGSRRIYEASVNYSAGSRLLEVRLGNRPVLFFPIDLHKMWKKEDVLLGLESSFNSSVVYSWRLITRIVPKGLHSVPVDPRARVRVRSKNEPCYLTIVSAVMIAIGCCVFVVFMVMFFKVNFTDWDKVMEMECVLKPVGKGYEKVGVDVENNVYGNVKC